MARDVAKRARRKETRDRKAGPAIAGGDGPADRLFRAASDGVGLAGDTHSALQALLKHVCRVPGIQSAGIYFLDPEAGEFTLVISRGVSRTLVRATTHVPLDSPRGRLLLRGRPFSRTLRFTAVRDEYRGSGIRALGVVPVRHEGETVASLNYASRTLDRIPPPLRAAMETLAARLSGLFVRVRQEAAGEAAHDKLQSLYNVVDDLLFVLDSDGTILDLNPAALRRFGADRAGIVGRRIGELFEPDGTRMPPAPRRGAGAACPMARHGMLKIAGGDRLPVEVRRVRGRWARRPVWVAVARDVSERMAYERWLLRTIGELRDFQKMVNVSGAIVLTGGVGDAAWSVPVVTENIAQFGYAPADFSSGRLTWKQIVHPDDFGRVEEDVRNFVAERRRTFASQYRILTRAGEIRWIQVHNVATYDDAGGALARIHALVVDITGRVQAEQSSRDAAARFGQLAEHIHQLFFIKAYPSLVDLYLSPAFERIWGVPASIAAKDPQGWRQAVDPEDWPAMFRMFRGAKDGRPRELEFRIRRPSDGARRWILGRLFPIRDERGAVCRVGGTMEDITERKEAEAALRRRIEAERVLMTLSTRLVKAEGRDPGTAIRPALADLGRCVGADRCLMLEISPDRRAVAVAYEWCRRGVPAVPNRLSCIPAGAFAWAGARLQRLEVAAVGARADLPAEAAQERQALRAMGVEATLMVPMAVRHVAIGALVYHARSARAGWTQEEINLARMAAEILAHVLAHRRAEEALERRRAMELALMRISTRFVRMPGDGVPKAIRQALGDLGRFARADRCLLFEFSEDRTTFAATHEWCRPGVPSVAARIAGVATAGSAWSAGKLGRGEAIAVGSRAELPPEATHERLSSIRLGYQAFLVVPIRIDNVVIGCLAYHALAPRAGWTEDEINLGRMAGEIVVHVLAHRRAQAALRRSVELEEKIAMISSRFVKIGHDQLDEAITGALEELARLLGVERTFLLQFSEDRQTFSMTHEWCPSNVRPHRNDLVRMPLSAFSWTAGRLLAGETVSIPRMEDFPPEAEPERQFHMSSDTFSCAFIPVLMKDQVSGCLGFDALRAPRKWTEEDIRLGRLIGEIVVHALAHRQSAESIRLSESRYRMIMEEAGDAIFVVEPQGRIADANLHACAMCGYPRERLVGLPLRRFLPAVEERALVASRRRLETGASLLFTQTVRRSDGARILAETRARMLPDGRILAIARDITERRRLEKEILHIAGREQQRIGHDLHDTLGQQLTGIAFLSKALQQTLAARQAPEAAEAGQIAALLGKAVGQTRYIAHGLAPAEVGGTGLADVLRQLAQETRETFNVECRFRDRDGGTLQDSVTVNQLHQIALEAVHNAVRHGRSSRIEIELRHTGRRGSLTVRDDGVWAEPPKGRGMGLRVMRHRAEIIGGTLSIEHHPRRGTTLTCAFEERGSLTVGEIHDENTYEVGVRP